MNVVVKYLTTGIIKMHECTVTIKNNPILLDLMLFLNLKHCSQLVTRSLALLKIASEFVDENGQITFLKEDGTVVKIDLVYY